MSNTNKQNKRPDPAILFYTSDFLARTYGWTNEQRGAFVVLICLQHQNGHLAKKTLVDICNGEDETVFSKFTEDEGGLFYNLEAEQEIIRRGNYCKSRSDNAKGGKKDNNGNTRKTSVDNPTKDDSLPF